MNVLLSALFSLSLTGPDYGALLEEEESEGGEGTEDRQIDKYKKLLLDIDSEERRKEREIQMEITWEPGMV